MNKKTRQAIENFLADPSQKTWMAIGKTVDWEKRWPDPICLGPKERCPYDSTCPFHEDTVDKRYKICGMWSVGKRIPEDKLSEAIIQIVRWLAFVETQHELKRERKAKCISC